MTESRERMVQGWIPNQHTFAENLAEALRIAEWMHNWYVGHKPYDLDLGIQSSALPVLLAALAASVAPDDASQETALAFCGKHPKLFNETPAQAWHRAHVDPKDGDSSGHCIRCDLEKAGDYLHGFHDGLVTAPAASVAEPDVLELCCKAICAYCDEGIPLDKNGRHTGGMFVGTHCYAKLMREAVTGKIAARAVAEPPTSHGPACAEIVKLRHLVEHSRDGMLDGQPYILTYSDIIEILEEIERVAATPLNADELAQAFHESYERLAPQFSYETRKASAKPWAEVPENNRKLMTAVCAEIMGRFSI